MVKGKSSITKHATLAADKLQSDKNLCMYNVMAYNFEEKNIIVTGAGRNIGRGIAKRLAETGARVYALDCIKETLDSLVKEVPNIQLLHQDLENWEETKDTVMKLDNLDGLVNCAGVIFPPEKAVNVSKETIVKSLNVNLLAHINLMQEVGKKMMSAGKGGSIVNISSGLSQLAFPDVLPYAVAKAGLNMATRMFALELGPHKIRVNAICPGLVDTHMARVVVTDEFIKQGASKIPIGRLCEIEDVVNYVLFLLSDQSLMINGTVSQLDGGQTCQVPM